MSLLADHNLPFAVALALMLLLALMQMLGLGHVFGDHDLDADADGGSALDGLLSVIGFGRVPLMIWLATLLFLFAGIGAGGQALAGSLLGNPLGPLLAAVLAGLVALPLTGALVRPLAYILPGDETTAVGLDSLVGRRARIVTGLAAAGSPARAQVKDRHGHPHHVMVEPHDPGAEIGEGEEVLLVRRENETFYGLVLQDRRLGPV